MSSYLSNAQFVQQAGAAYQAVDSTVLTAACAWASTKADMYLSKRYQLPIVSFDDDLSSLVFALALWKVATQQGFRPGSGQNEVIVKQYDDAIKELTMISKGDLTINVTDSSPTVDEEGSQAASDCRLGFSDVIGRGGR